MESKIVFMRNQINRVRAVCNCDKKFASLANAVRKRFLIGVHKLDQLELSELRQLNAAIGWLGLNCPGDARLELDSIPTETQSHPAVLEARWLLCAHEKNWSDALIVAEREVLAAPDNASGWLHRAYALRRVAGGGLSQAWEALLPMAQKFPNEAVIAYNLACYACQMNQMETAKDWLQRAIKIGDKEAIRKMALADEDLKPLWTEIKNL